jgi:hypothetical protein
LRELWALMSLMKSIRAFTRSHQIVPTTVFDVAVVSSFMSSLAFRTPFWRWRSLSSWYFSYLPAAVSTVHWVSTICIVITDSSTGLPNRTTKAYLTW